MVGESHRQPALRRHLENSPERLVVAQLVRDRGNPHDAGAVAVFVGSDHVGYIPRRDLGSEGQTLYRALARLAGHGVPATCWARLNGGEPGKPSVGISLFTGFCEKPDRPYPFPITVPPDETARVLGTDGHEALVSRLIGRGEQAVTGCILGIAETHPTRPREAGPIVTVAIDGVVIGGLSSAESARRLAIVRELAEAGRRAQARMTIRRSTRAAGGFNCAVSTVMSPTPVCAETRTTAERGADHRPGPAPSTRHPYAAFDPAGEPLAGEEPQDGLASER